MDPTRFDKEMSSLTGVLKVLQHAVRREHGPVHECAFELPEMNATIYDELFLHGIDYIYAWTETIYVVMQLYHCYFDIINRRLSDIIHVLEIM